MQTKAANRRKGAKELHIFNGCSVLDASYIKTKCRLVAYSIRLRSVFYLVGAKISLNRGTKFILKGPETSR